MTLRIRNALSVKEAVFRRYLQGGIVGKSDVLVVAVNIHQLGGSADMDDLMMRSLYGVGDPFLTIDGQTGRVVDRGHQQVAQISKVATGAAVGVQPFIDESMSHISAVVGSRADVVNLPGRLGDDLALFPNPTARIRWPDGALRIGGAFILTSNEGGWKGERVSYVQKSPPTAAP
jgi:hypothetical protein